MRKNAFRAGFTLIELSLSLVFISLLSLAIVLIIMNTISSYRRGMILGQLNSTGSELVDDIRMAVQNSSAESVQALCAEQYTGSMLETCKKDNAKNFVYLMRVGNVVLNSGEQIKDVPLFGAFCTGSYSYIWNSGYYFMDGTTVEVVGANLTNANPRGSAVFKYLKPGDTNPTEISGFRLLKVKDEARQVCVAKATDGMKNNKYNAASVNGDMNANLFDTTSTKIAFIEEEPVEILNVGDNTDMAFYDFSIAAPAEGEQGGSLFYAGSFILGTIQGGPNIKTANSTCATPNDVSSNFDYCAINRFNFAAQTGGE